MAHPFSKIFLPALRKSTLEDNHVLTAANTLCARGYSLTEVCGVLKTLQIGTIDEVELEIISDALHELELQE